MALIVYREKKIEETEHFHKFSYRSPLDVAVN